MKAFLGLDTSEFTTGIDRVTESVSRLSRGAVSGTFRNIAQDIASASSPAEALAITFNSLGNTLRGTIFGAAGLAIGKILSAPFEQLSQIVKESSASVDQVLNQISKAGSVSNLQQGISEMGNMQQAIDAITKSIQNIDNNAFLRVASAVSGTRKELEAMRMTLENLGNARILEGITRESQTQAFRMGLSPDDQRLFDISERTRARVQQVRSATTPGAEQDAAVLEAFNMGARERNAALDQMAAEQAKKEFEEKEKLAKAYAELVQGFDETLSNRRQRKDQEEHDDKMKRINELLAKPVEKPAAEPIRRSSFEVLTDSLRKRGGGGTFAQVGGVETVQKDQLAVLKNIEKNTAKAGGMTPMGVE